MPNTIEHPSFEMIEAGKIIHTLHDQVCSQSRRIHITRAGCDDVCVMISKKELESLEHALNVVADSESFTALCAKLNALLQTAGMVYPQ